jgi:hypothetical protein
MFAPVPGEVPSEATIEQIANHQLLNIIGPYSTWFFVPTRHQERHLGYDASLSGQKALVIQYKRLSLRRAPGTGSIKLSPRQHSTLLANFPPGPSPYVFYGFSLVRSYADLGARFSRGAGWLMGLETIFVDVHTIAAGIKRMPWAHIVTHGISLHDLAHNFLSCTAGIRVEQPDNFIERIAHARERVRRINLMWSKVPVR